MITTVLVETLPPAARPRPRHRRCDGCRTARATAERVPGAFVPCLECGAEFISDGTHRPTRRPRQETDDQRWTRAEQRTLRDMATAALALARESPPSAWPAGGPEQAESLPVEEHERSRQGGQHAPPPPALAGVMRDAAGTIRSRRAREFATRLLAITREHRDAGTALRIVAERRPIDSVRTAPEVIGEVLAGPRARAAWRALDSRRYWQRCAERGEHAWEVAVEAWTGVVR